MTESDVQLIVKYLRGRGVDEDILQELIRQKIDVKTVCLLDDEVLARYIPAIGDRTQLREFCQNRPRHSKNDSECKSEVISRKVNLFTMLRQKMKKSVNTDLLSDEESEISRPAQTVKTIRRSKRTRLIDIGWIHEGKSLRKSRGFCGKSIIRIPKVAVKDDIISEAKRLFFPNGLSKVGHIDTMAISLVDCDGNIIPEGATVEDVCNGMKSPGSSYVRFYLSTELLSKDIAPDTIATDHCSTDSNNMEVNHAPSTCESTVGIPTLTRTATRKKSRKTSEAQRRNPDKPTTSSMMLGDHFEMSTVNDLPQPYEESRATSTEVFPTSIAHGAQAIIESNITELFDCDSSIHQQNMTATPPLKKPTASDRSHISTSHITNSTTSVIPLDKTSIEQTSLCTQTCNAQERNDDEKYAFIVDNDVLFSMPLHLNCIEESGDNLAQNYSTNMPLIDHKDSVDPEMTFYNSELKSSDINLSNVPDVCSVNAVNEFYINASESGDSIRALETPVVDATGDKESVTITLHRNCIQQEMITIFKQPDIVDTQINVNFVNEIGQDASGVSRDAYTAFWQSFFLQNAEGLGYRVPTLCPEYGLDEWMAIGRILVKGYRDHKYFPVHFAPAFAVAVIHGEDSVHPIVLRDSFMQYISPSEKEVVEAALENRDYDEDELLDIFAQAQCHRAPDSASLVSDILQIAHKVIIQDAKYALDAIASVSRQELSGCLPTPDDVLSMYEDLKPSVSKVIGLLRGNPISKEQNACLGYLHRFIKGRNEIQLKKLLRFLTAADIICVQSIKVEFVTRYGFGRVPTVHTCGPVLELPSTYVNFPDFRAEWENLLEGKECMEMNIA